MTTKQLLNQKNSILAGLHKAASVVASTMGGNGKTVIIADNENKVRFTKDGVTVADSIKFEDPIENIGAQMLISAAKETVERCGDGTTLTSVLLSNMLKNFYDFYHEEANLNEVITDMEVTVDRIVKKLKKRERSVKNTNDVYNIAKTSANSEKIGELFKEIYTTTGLEALVTVEYSEESLRTYYDVVQGVEFDSGYVHPSFMTNRATERAVYENAYIHVSQSGITNMTDELSSLLSFSIEHQHPLVVIAPRFSDATVRLFSMQKVNQGAPVVLIKTPGYGHHKPKNMKDIESFLSEDGTVDKIIVSPNSFILFNEDTPYLQDRLDELKSLKENAIDKLEEQDYEKRIWNLKAASAIIYAGGETPESKSEEYDRIEDAIGAVRSALESGYVAGGGLTFYNVAKEILEDETLSLGEVIVYNTIYKPFKTILENANEDYVSISKKCTEEKGYDVKTRNFVNFYKEGIVDPTLVLEVALRKALAVTKLIIDSSYTIFNEYKQKAF